MSSNRIVVNDVDREPVADSIDGSSELSAIQELESVVGHKTDAREANRFLLCVVSSQSAKRIKATAEKMGESLSMTMVVRAFLRSYRLAEKNGNVLLAASDPDSAELQNLRKRVLRDEIARNSKDCLRNSKNASGPFAYTESK